MALIKVTDIAYGRLRSPDLDTAEEIFLTNALIGIRPVRTLEHRPFAPGALTQRLQESLAPWLEAHARLPEGLSDA